MNRPPRLPLIPASAAGPGDVCVTCSDEAVAVRVLRLLDDDLAVVDADGSAEQVSVALVDAAAGDVVLVHAKEAISVVGRAGK